MAIAIEPFMAVSMRHTSRAFRHDRSVRRVMAGILGGGGLILVLVLALSGSVSEPSLEWQRGELVATATAQVRRVEIGKTSLMMIVGFMCSNLVLKWS